VHISGAGIDYHQSSGAPGLLEQVEIDTKNFLGNFPESCEIHGIYATSDFDWSGVVRDDSLWTLILPRTKLGPDRQHYFELENVENRIYTHIRVTIYPDGGLKRVRILGRRAEEPIMTSESENRVAAEEVHSGGSEAVIIPVVPLTTDAYESYGQVIQAYNADSIPDGLRVTAANGGTAQKFHKLSPLTSTYPSDAGATTCISVYRCQPLQDIKEGSTILSVLERHSHTSQAFIPMGSATGSVKSGDSYLVVVAHNGVDDRPDMKTLRAFFAGTTQGISYNPGVWRTYQACLS
jgi:allantoicase